MHVDLIMMANAPPRAVRALGALVIAVLASCGRGGSKPDGGAISDGPSADASSFGIACTTSSECPGSGFCIDGFGGKVCSYTCTDGCPGGWACRGTKVDGTIVSVCLPPEFDLCTACTGEANCGGGACVLLGGQKSCIPPCPFEGACPTGYTCGPDPTGSHAGKYCVPDAGGCSCTQDNAGQVRSCTNSNASGTCSGLEKCDPNNGGWSGCTAATAMPEICDGLDNDCNHLIDDGTSGGSCMVTVAGVGSCPGVALCTGAAGTLCQGPTPKPETCNYIDDNCNGMVDETFPDLNTVCNAGVGACLRFGVKRCTAAGDATECSAVAGSPGAELCNGIDDNCNGLVDETFTTLGQVCSVGAGACARSGNLVCNAAGTGTTCSVAPGMTAAETCNGLDDDCDGMVDEDFRDPATGFYNRDTACGSCTVDCTAIYALPNASGHCTVTTSAQCTMVCAPNAFDLDGLVANGCELAVDPQAVYVSTGDPAAADDASCGLGPVGTGAGHHPCKTIAQGLARASGLGRSQIFVANGTYPETVAIPNGRSLLGGYFPDTWQRDVASTGTLITGIGSTGNHDHTVTAINITTATVFEGFAVYGSVNPKTSGNSYAIYVSGSNANLTIRNNTVFGGRGGPGSNGTMGMNGVNGADGSGRNPDTSVADVAYDAHAANGAGECDATNDRQYANGGATTCPGGDDVSGGSGGGNRCAAMGSCTGCTTSGCTACTFSEFTAIDGVTGQPGAGPSGGAGGVGEWAGDDMVEVDQTCYLSSGDPDPDPDNTYGLDGDDGKSGAHGASGPGCVVTTGAVSGGDWIGGAASAGVVGGNGGGAGGGGAGGGAKCQTCVGSKDNLGGHGGGGGAGGCGGVGGGPATAGGGAFGIFIVGGTAPIVTGNTLFGGQGGVGGVGGAAGRGGSGGNGALGGTAGVPAVFCSDVAGRGGNGGDGGDGAGGGGGCGGSSFGIYTAGVGAPNYCQATATNTFNGGAGGAGGGGGYSIINPGGIGANGAILSCSFN